MVTQNLDLKQTQDQLDEWNIVNEMRELDKKKPFKTWKPPLQLGDFHKDYVGHRIEIAHNCIADARALYAIEIKCDQLKRKRDQWRRTKYLAKPVNEIVARAVENASTYGERQGHEYSRPPYGKAPPNCHHRYPCSVYAFKQKNSDRKTVIFKCNSDFNEKFRNPETGEDRRCSFKMKGTDWEQERNLSEQMQIAIQIENETQQPSVIQNVRL